MVNDEDKQLAATLTQPVAPAPTVHRNIERREVCGDSPCPAALATIAQVWRSPASIARKERPAATCTGMVDAVPSVPLLVQAVSFDPLQQQLAAGISCAVLGFTSTCPHETCNIDGPERLRRLRVKFLNR